MKRYHVTPKGGQWQVKGENAERAVSLHETKVEALQAGRGIAQNAKGQLLVHGRDGVIQTEWTYGHDPRNIPG